MPLGMYLGAIAAFLLSIFWKPEIGIYYLVPLLPMQTARFWLHAFPLGEKLVDVLLLGVFIGLFFHSERPLFASSPLNKVLIFLFALTYVSLWQGAFYLNVDLPISYLDPRFSDWKNYVEMLIIFFAVAGAIRKPKQMVFLMILMGVSLLVVNRSYHSTIGGRDFSHFDYDLRDAGPLGYAGENGMGAFQSELAVFLVGISAFVKQRTWKLAIWGLTATSIYCLVLTFSRGAYLGFLVGILVLGIIKNRKLLFLLAILLATWQSIVPNAVRERVFMTYTDGQGLDQSAGDRVSLWQDAMTVVDTDPIFGTGYNTYEYMRRVGPYSDTHNYYVKVLLETGVFGLLIFLWLLGVTGRMAWRLFRSTDDPLLSGLGCAFFAMFICAVIVNIFGDRWTYLQECGFYWVLLGMVARALLIAKQEQQAPELTQESIATISPAEQEVSHA